MPNEWFINKDNQTQGPLSDQQVKKLAELGQITPATRIRLGAGTWSTASSVKGLFPKTTPKPQGEIDDLGFDALFDSVVRDGEGDLSHRPVVAGQAPTTKTCPFCSEEIKFSAVKCKHCGEFLSEGPISQPARRNAVSSTVIQAPKPPLGPERTLWEGKPDYRSYLPAWLFGGLSWFLCAITFAAAAISTKPQETDTLFWLAFSLLAAGACSCVFAWLHRNSVTYRRTTHRIVCEWGIISTQANEARISDITALNLKQSGIDALFGIGNIELCTSGTSGVEVYLRAIPNPKQVREDIRLARDAYGAST